MKKRKYKMNFGGNLVGAALGLTLNTYNSMKDNNLAMRTKRRNSEVNQRILEDNLKEREGALLDSFPSYGVRRISNFGLGGDLDPGSSPFKGKHVRRIKGDNHGQDSDGDGQDGVPVVNAEGDTVAEIEGGEVVFDGLVFSKRLKAPTGNSFADEAMRLSSTQAYRDAVKAEQAGEGIIDNPQSDHFEKGTLERNIEKNPNPLRRLFSMQEVVKQQELQEQQQEVPEGKLGINLRNLLGKKTEKKEYDVDGNLVSKQSFADKVEDRFKNLTQGNAAEELTPFIDNFVNRRLINNTPKLPAPVTTQAPRLETDINVNPQLDDINTTLGSLRKGIRSSTASGSTANSQIIAAELAGLRERNNIRGGELNQELELRNQQKSLTQQTEQQNNALLNDFNRRGYERRLGIQQNRSANVANLTEDLRTIQRDRANDTLSRQKLALIAAQYADSGVLARADLDEIMKKIDGGEDIGNIINEIEEAQKRKNLSVPKEQ